MKNIYDLSVLDRIAALGPVDPIVITPRRGGGTIVTDLSQVHEEAIRTKLIEMGWRPPESETEIPVSTHKLNADQTVAVATDVYFNPDMSTAPRGVKLQLIGEGGVAVYGTYNGDPFWQEWAPVPKRRKAP
jgi:UDP-N-acetylglucosamine enolpyruvyl transferase